LVDKLGEEHGSLGSPGIDNLKWLKTVYSECQSVC
ncbi:MAG: hypothetical protein ACJAYN_001842, partial [Bermanella sp.]